MQSSLFRARADLTPALVLVLALALSPTLVAAACAPDPSVAGLTANDRTYYLSEIGGCGNLVCWTENLANTNYSNATLVIDTHCPLQETLQLPPRMVLAGVGMDGEGELTFSGLGYKQPGIAVVPGSGTAGVTIRDLRIAGDNSLSGRGIELDNAHQVIVERVRISGFGFGIYGRNSFSVVVDKSSLHNNNVNVYQDSTSNTWRITNSILNQAVRWGIYQTDNKGRSANQNSSVYANNRLESNGLGGIRVAAVGTVIQNNEFEGNGEVDASNAAIRVDSTAVDTRILSNFYSSDCPVDNGVDTEVAHDIHFFTNCP